LYVHKVGGMRMSTPLFMPGCSEGIRSFSIWVLSMVFKNVGAAGHPWDRVNILLVQRSQPILFLIYKLRKTSVAYTRQKLIKAVGPHEARRFFFEAVLLWMEHVNFAYNNKLQHLQHPAYWFSLLSLSLIHCHWTCLGPQKTLRSQIYQ
jgi:hypothetical protein